MIQLSPLSSINAAANQYWQLISVLLFNLKTVGYVYVVFLILALLAVLVSFVSPDLYVVGVAVTFLALFILAIVGIMGLPGAMLTLLSNRHIFAMADIRNKLFVIACVFCFLTSFLLVLSPFFIKKEALSFSVASYTLLSCSLYFWLATYMCSKRYELLFVAYLVMVAWFEYSFEVMVAQQPVALLLMVLLTWTFFYRWWIAFSPRRHRVKSIFVETDVRRIRELSVEYLSPTRVKTPVGSLLQGYGDGAGALVKTPFFVYSSALLFSLYICGGMIDWEFTDSAFMATLIGLGYSFLISSVCFKGNPSVRRAWLAFAGDRLDLFLYLEREFFKRLSILAALNLILITMLLFVSNHPNYFMYCIGAQLGLSLLVVLTFYSDIYFYKRGAVVPGDINLYKTAVNMICFVPLIGYLVVKYQAFNVFEVKDVFAISVMILVLLSLKMVRSQAIKKWRKADF
jgi:hypothetical protein